MTSVQWLLEFVLLGMLALTMLHAIRLERSLGAVRRDRAALSDLAGDFDAGAREAAAGLERLRSVSNDTTRSLARQIDTSTVLKDDLAFLIERGERLADRIDGLIRENRSCEQGRQSSADASLVTKITHQAERDLLVEARGGR